MVFIVVFISYFRRPPPAYPTNVYLIPANNSYVLVADYLQKSDHLSPLRIISMIFVLLKPYLSFTISPPRTSLLFIFAHFNMSKQLITFTVVSSCSAFSEVGGRNFESTVGFSSVMKE